MSGLDLSGVPSNGGLAPPSEAEVAPSVPLVATSSTNGYCYDDLFPALPESNSSSDFANGNHDTRSGYSSWGKQQTVPAVRSQTKTEFFTIASEERRHKDPASGKFGGSVDCDQASDREKKLCYDVGKMTTTSIELNSSKPDGGLTVVINGRPERVHEAKVRIMQALVREAQVDLVIPKEHHRHILGSKAQKLRTLESETGTKVNVPRPDENSEVISIKGPKEGIEEARQRIQTLSDELSKHANESLDIEKKYHVFIMGPNNKTIEAIRSLTRARVRIPALSNKEDTIISISGEKEGVAEAKLRIASIYNECKANVKDTSMQVPKEQHKYILGRGGQTLQDMFERTGVWIEVPPQDSTSQTIKLLGEPGKLGQALSLVYEKANSVIKVEMDAPAWLHKHLIGRKGENINRVRENFKDAFVEFVDNSIRLEGPRDSVDHVRKLLQSEMDEITSKTTCAEVHADPSYHPHIIGKSGSNVNRLKQELNVKIHIPAPNEERSQMISIEGEPGAVAKAKKELEEMVKKLKNEASKDLKCESRLHGLIIGPGGEKIQEIRKKFNQVNIAFPDASKNLDVVTIRGDKGDVDKCHKFLSEMVKELLLTNHKLDLMLFKQFLRYLQSPKGREILKSIQHETGVRIALPKEGATSDMVFITGEKAKTDKAKLLLLDAQRKNSDIVEKDVMIPNKVHGALLRSKRSLLNSILEEAGCNPAEIDVQFPPNGSNSDKCIISGPKDMVDQAKKRLVEEANERALASYSEEVRAKAAHHRFLIGRQGVNIKKLREKTSARVIFPAEDSDDRETIMIIGREAAVKSARKELENMIAELENVTEDTLSIPVKYHKHFVARRGEVLVAIAEEFGGVQVSFPKSAANSDLVTLKGAKECVSGAKQRLQEMTKELDAQVYVNCYIPQMHHRAVMGAKGAKVQAVTKQYNVQVKFPERAHNGDAATEENGGDENDPRNIIMISGLAEDCEAAKIALESLVPVSVEVPVDAKLHRYIIGQKGKDVRELMDKFDVNIKVPQASENVNFVRVTGPSANVEKCKLELWERIQQLEGEDEDRKLKAFQLTVDVPAKHHPKIVGRRGAVVTKLREKYDVRIQFPQKTEGADAGVSSDTITVTGYEKDAYAARDAILKMVGELEEMITRAIKIDHRIHSRIIGSKGRNVRKIMEDHKVEIKFPRETDSDPDLVEITGLDEHVEEAIAYLKDMEDELMEFVQEEAQYQRPPQHNVNNIFHAGQGGHVNRQGFVVKGAPWEHTPPSSHSHAPDTTSQSDFPSFGASGGGPTVAWGPRR